MSFTLMIFLLAFLPAYLIFHTLVPSTRGKNIVLLVFSCLFYAYGGIPCLLLLLADALLGFQAGRLLEKTHHKRYLVLPIIVWLGLLGVFKYAGFFGKNIGALFGDPLMVHLALPMGISFYTFKLISYLADVWQDRCPAEKSPLSFLCYVTTFHQVLQGPIVRYPDMREALHERTVNREAMISGLVRFSTGLFKKAVLADYCGTLADTLLPLDGSIGTVPKAGLWIGSVLFTMQIYLDFSAYSDMAIALGTMSGFTCPENFNYPYAAVSVKDFWRRWHISLSTWFRDYLYIPLGGSRKGLPRTILNLGFVFLITGLWHGPVWTFVVWGAMNGTLVIIERLLGLNREKERPALLNAVLHVYCVLAFTLCFVVFNSDSLRHAGAYFLAMAGLSPEPPLHSLLYFTDIVPGAVMCLAAALSTPLFSKLIRPQSDGISAARTALQDIFLLAVLVLSAASIMSADYNPFIYFRF